MPDIVANREGGDITAQDMVVNEEPSKIVQFYSQSTVFLTGATGFLGKLFLEKLLRTCEDIKHVYILVRQKKNRDEESRFEDIFKEPNFNVLKRKLPNFLNKITLIRGDCALPDLGMSQEDKQKLISEVDFVLHCAATVRFDQKLKAAAYINVRSVRDLMIIAEKMPKLKAFLYVSTAYCNGITRKTVTEQFYEAPISSENLLDLIELLPDSKLDEITPALLGEFPNTYIYTKIVAEDLIRRRGSQLPIGIIRPSIVIATVKEPVSGWIDNFYGATGIFAGAALGVIRSLHCKGSNIADMVPADYVVNCGLATAWEIASKKALNRNQEIVSSESDSVPIYNFVSYPEAKITWSEYMSLGEKHAPPVATPLQVWSYFFKLRSCKYDHKIAAFLYHTVPAYIVDIFLLCVGKEPVMVNHYKRVAVFLEVISYFSTKEWVFTNNNVQSLWKKMKSKDRELFEFSMKNFDWDTYFYTYVRGMRVYLMKDPLETIPQGRVKYYKLKAAHYALIALVFYLLYKLLMCIFNLFV